MRIGQQMLILTNGQFLNVGPFFTQTLPDKYLHLVIPQLWQPSTMATLTNWQFHVSSMLSVPTHLTLIMYF